MSRYSGFYVHFRFLPSADSQSTLSSSTALSPFHPLCSSFHPIHHLFQPVRSIPLALTPLPVLSVSRFVPKASGFICSYDILFQLREPHTNSAALISFTR